jgi:hypothetical protein
MQSPANMDHASSLPEPVDFNVSRRDAFVAIVFTVLGLAAILAAPGGLNSMIAGSVGSVGAGCVAVGLTFLDSRLSYVQRAQASVPIVLMLAGVGVGIQGNALAMAGYPLFLLGIAGVIPALLRWRAASPVVETASDKMLHDRAVTSSALPNF